MTGWVERVVRIGSTELAVREAGMGRPLLVLHDELGATEWLHWHEDLAPRRKLIMPVLPGFHTSRVGWIRDVRDLAMFLGRMLREDKLVPLDVMGFSFGGWLAAEMAAANPGQFSRVVLVAPFGIKPPVGQILDMFIVTPAEYIVMSFASPATTPELASHYGTPSPQQVEVWEDARRECAELAWQPYMHDPSLEPLMAGVGALPTLILWGNEDKIVPESAMRAFENAIPKSQLKIFDKCGHRPEVERRQEFVHEVVRFLEK